jgi:hypothetical protein
MGRCAVKRLFLAMVLVGAAVATGSASAQDLKDQFAVARGGIPDLAFHTGHPSGAQSVSRPQGNRAAS